MSPYWRRLALFAAVVGAAVGGLSFLLSAAGVPTWAQYVLAGAVGVLAGLGWGRRELRR